MKKKSHTNVHFDYGGYYSEGNEWIYKNSLYAISFKTACLEKITYSVLLDKITTKVGQNGVPGNLRLSYNLSKARRETYIVDDEDVYIFLTECDEEGRIPVLHVELLSDNNQRVEVLVPERRSSVGVNYVELVNVNEGLENDVNEVLENDVNEVLVNDVNEVLVNDVNEVLVNEDMVNEVMVNEVCANVTGMEVVAVERSMDNHLDEDVDGMFDFDDIPAIPNRVKGTPKNIEWEDGTGIELYQEFCSKEALWELVNKAAKQLVYGVLTIKSDPLRLMLRCKQYSQGCKWYLRVARTKQSDYWSVRVHRKIHTCSRSVESTSNSVQRGTPRLIAAVLHADFPGNLQTPNPKSIMSIVTGRLGVHCSYSTALRGKMQHVSEVRGGPEKSYKMLFSYLYMLEKVNRGTVTSVELEEKKLKYLFIALGASIEGFRAMRKVIIVDATHLKTVYGGMLVIATAQDPNHHHYPLAFGVIDAEKDDSWIWFFQKLKTVYPEVPDLVFISDRHQSIKKAVMTVYPNAHHVHCIWHLSQNLRLRAKTDKDGAAKKFLECAHAYTESEFNREYGIFRSRWSNAADYLDRAVGREQWSRYHFQGDKYNIDTSNAAESMNAVFKKARKYHLLPMIDAMVEKFSEWFNNHRQDSGNASSTSQVVPFVENILHARCLVAAKLKVVELNSYRQEYNVIDGMSVSFLVDLKMKTCSCKTFDIDKYPCVHAIAAARFLARKEGRNADVSIYGLCSVFYLIDTWALAYYRTLFVVPHESEWNIPESVKELEAEPPDYTPKKGRNQDKRFPSVGEKRRKSNKAVPGINLERWLQPEDPEAS
ncbi:Zinc finger SWIM-type [Arabidopsis thaliana x Arabidopsis arenosa]|uniref:Zinc finger SWIM-type n=1 Tax=Arabidopsis thaliana x Arabidopsis arenosa TaxID=1240361 RepID=A0A8T1Z3T9_9BRAS|nr:Zinc finger SWIM-type [Arabidopsis thaliana x Arabidopsis arenosa]